MAPSPDITIRNAESSDADQMRLLTETNFAFRTDPELLKAEQQDPVFRTEDALIAVDQGRVVGQVKVGRQLLTVPGARAVEVAAISGVVVAPTHRRRGILRAMYTEQHRRTEEAGLPLTIFTVSEGTIYGRFGYGPVIVANSVTIDRTEAEFRSTAPDPGGVFLVDTAEAKDRIIDIYDRWHRQTIGTQASPPSQWRRVFADPESYRDGGTSLFTLLHADGYAQYRYMDKDDKNQVYVEDLRAVTPDAHVALWRALMGLDLIDEIATLLAEDDPLPYLLKDIRSVRVKNRHDLLWLRTMDIPAALTARTYLDDLDIVVAVDDPFRNAGGAFALRVRDGIAECEPTTRSADIELGIDVLASMYLGTYSPRLFAAANRLQAKDSGTVRALEAAFRTEHAAKLGWHF
ncbi:GNAT family N-acetyltransferase [Nocardia panacis]|uniref:GNAT family N-acetyltransferase n=1 Tax=Nocardia panacis TaxID=2340916 RepID=A0A3A4L7E0_9NOCA|nr:GNAT family N-acetyltransferase [Nocardia panacis]RJO78802.1 GNAT family N-acetyltransferase [Nocardia panacis]